MPTFFWRHQIHFIIFSTWSKFYATVIFDCKVMMCCEVIFISAVGTEIRKSKKPLFRSYPVSMDWAGQLTLNWYECSS